MACLKSNGVFILFLIVLTACFAAKKENELPEKLLREWKLTEVSGFNRGFLMKENAGIRLDGFPFKVETTSGSAEFRVQTDSDRNIRFSQCMPTGDHQNSPLLKAICARLKKMNSYKIEGHFLMLTDRSGNHMRFVAAEWD